MDTVKNIFLTSFFIFWVFWLLVPSGDRLDTKDAFDRKIILFFGSVLGISLITWVTSIIILIWMS